MCKIPVLIRLLPRMLGALALAPAAHAASDCAGLSARLLATQPLDAQAWHDSPCPELIEALSKDWRDTVRAQLEQADAELPEEDRWNWSRFVEAEADAAIKLALLRGDRAEADHLIGAYLQRGDAGSLTIHEPDSSLNLDRIQAILLGREPKATLAADPDLDQAWIVDRGLITLDHDLTFWDLGLETKLPTTTDAWIAVGEPEHGILSYANRYWRLTMADFTLPPDLRTLMERVYGLDGAEAKFAAALDSIESKQTPNGPVARVQLLGQWFPLPAGERDFDWKSAKPEQDALRELGAIDTVSKFYPFRPATYPVATLRKFLRDEWESCAMERRMAHLLEPSIDCVHHDCSNDAAAEAVPQAMNQ